MSLLNIVQQELKKSFSNIRCYVNENIDDIELVGKALKLEIEKMIQKTYEKNSDWEPYDVILSRRMKKLYDSFYEPPKDKTIEFSLPDAEFFEDSIKNQFIKTTTTDYAKICGGGEERYFSNRYDECEGYLRPMFKDKMLSERKSKYYLKTSNWYECDFVNKDEIEHGMYAKHRFLGIRPIIDLSRTDYEIISADDYYEVDNFLFPQMLTPDNVAAELEHAYLSNSLVATGKKYPYVEDAENDNKIDIIWVAEYSYKGKKYVRVKHNILDSLYQYRLSNGKLTDSQSIYWLEATPIKFVAFPKDKILLSKYTIMSGIPYNWLEGPHFYLKKLFEDQRSLLNKNQIFEMTYMYMFLNEYMKTSLLMTTDNTVGAKKS